MKLCIRISLCLALASAQLVATPVGASPAEVAEADALEPDALEPDALEPDALEPDALEPEGSPVEDAEVDATPERPDAAVEPNADAPAYPDRPDLAGVARASLAVDTSSLGAQSLVLLRRIEELGNIELRRAEILPGRSENDPVIQIHVSALEDGGYQITSSLMIAGERVENSMHDVRCTLCTEGESVDRARIEVGRLIPFVRGHATRVVEEAKARAEANRQPAEDEDDGSGQFNPKSKAGIALLVVGVAGVGAGVPLALRAPTPKPDMPLETINTRPPGYALLGVGAALVLIGTGLLIAGLRPRARAQARVLPVPTPGGVAVVGRF